MTQKLYFVVKRSANGQIFFQDVFTDRRIAYNSAEIVRIKDVVPKWEVFVVTGDIPAIESVSA